MKLLRRWFGSDALQASHARKRWIVVDTETTGVDPGLDALLAIGAVAVDDEGIRAQDSFELVLRHDGTIEPDNAVVHGLGQAAVDAGATAPVALDAFRQWAEGAPCVAFHADFDRRVLERAARLAGVPPLAGPWLDLAPLAAALRPEVPRRGTGALDDWLAAYGIECAGRHNAASDALAAAELLLRLRAEAAAQGSVGFDGLAAVARQRRWLGHHR